MLHACMTRKPERCQVNQHRRPLLARSPSPFGVLVSTACSPVESAWPAIDAAAAPLNARDSGAGKSTYDDLLSRNPAETACERRRRSREPTRRCAHRSSLRAQGKGVGASVNTNVFEHVKN